MTVSSLYNNRRPQLAKHRGLERRRRGSILGGHCGKFYWKFAAAVGVVGPFFFGSSEAQLAVFVVSNSVKYFIILE